MGMQRQGVRFAPRIPPWQLPRPALVARLEAAFEAGLVVVRGGAGAGKTSVIAEWAASTGRPGAWVAVHGDTATRFSLWEHTLRAIDDAAARTALAGLEPANETHLRLALADVLGEGRVVVVLDDYHLVTDARVHEDVAWLVTHAGARIVVATRLLSPFEQPALGGRLDAAVLPPESLPLTPEESAALLAPLAGPSADEAYRRLAGWPLATRALATELARRGPGADLDAALAAVAALLAAERPSLPEMFDDAAVRDAATRLSLAEWLTDDLAAALVPAGAAGVVRALEHEGLGAWHDSPDGRVFQLLPSLRLALAPDLDELPPAELRALRRAYATWADAAGQSVIAGRQAVELGDWSLLADLAQRHFRRLMRLHRSEWREIVTQVPLDRLRTHPVLGATALQLLNAESAPTDRMRALATVLGNAIGPLRERGSTADRIWRNASALAVERIGGRYVAASATADRLTELIGALTPEEHARVADLLPLLSIHLGTTRLYGGDPVGAVAPLLEALRMPSDSQWSPLHARSLLALVAALRGDMEIARAESDELDATMTISGWRGTYSAAGYHLARAALALERFDAARALEEVDVLEPHFDTIEHWPLILRMRALAALVSGAPAAAAARLPELVRVRSRRAPTSAAMKTLLASTHADLLLGAGSPRAAERALSRDAADSPLHLVSASRVALALGDDGRALSLVAGLDGVGGSSPRTLAGVLLTRAVAHERLGTRGDARAALRAATAVMVEHGLRLPLGLVPRAPLEELVAADRNGSSAEAARLLEEIPALLPSAPGAVRLTAREAAVLGELERTSSTQTISAALYVSPNTVKSQLRSLYRKLGASSRDEALATARSAGLLRR